MVGKCSFFSSKKTIKTVSKSLIYGAHVAIPCAPKISVFGTVGAHDAWSCAFSVFEISEFETHPKRCCHKWVINVDYCRQL